MKNHELALESYRKAESIIESNIDEFAINTEDL